MANVSEKIEIIDVKMSADRWLAGKEIDIRGITVEINIYENINVPFLTGDITVVDDDSIFTEINISGTEKLRFSFKSVLSDIEIVKNFVITNVSSIKSNDNVSLLICSMVEDVAYFSNVQAVSKSYTGFGEDIIRKIVTDNLNTAVIYDSPSQESAQAPFRYIPPYITPFEAAKNVLRKMTTDRGLPFFLFAALNEQYVQLKSMETILLNEPFNASKPLTFSQAVTNSNRDENQFFVLNTFDESPHNEDTMKLAMGGAIGSRINVVDITSGDVIPFNIDITTIIDALIEAGITDQPLKLTDNKFIPDPTDITDGITLNNYTSKVFTKITSETYPLGPLGFDQQALNAHYYLEYVRNGILQHLTKNMYRVSGPGAIMTDGNKKTSVGNQVAINILSNKQTAAGLQRTIDPKRSGNFIILSKRYQFDVPENNHTYTMDVARITNQRRVT